MRKHLRALMEGFVQTVGACGLLDLGFVGNQFTWERSRGKYNWVQEQLDRGLANQAWRDLFPAAKVKVWDVSTSDHFPLYLQLNKQVYVPRVTRFRFENVWIREKECLNLVKHAWASTEGQGILDKIQFCCFKLHEWGGGETKKFRDKIQIC